LNKGVVQLIRKIQTLIHDEVIEADADSGDRLAVIRNLPNPNAMVRRRLPKLSK